MRQPREILEKWLSAINEDGKGVTIWEQEFCDSLDSQLTDFGRISEKQEQILERIYAERTS